uniref:F-box/LRR-repeat protein 15/At3g58940/PEG3-like LRR domain-containing protein n=1 Tax=Solanum lycopersicum TaxID=4081 RepID=A0A3Q7H7J7_SOLLC
MPPDEQGLMWKVPEDLTSPTIGFIPILDSFLRHLYLKECEIQIPCFIKGFIKLIRLTLKSITLSSDTFKSLISNCPLLEDLVLKDIDNLYPMSINASKLRSFVFRGDIQLIHLENVPVLSNVLYTPRELVLQDEDDFVNIFSSIPALDCFSWDFFEVDNGSTEVIPTRLPSALNCLKCLFMSWITLGQFFELSFALCIIRSSPNLEEIEIKVVTNVNDIQHLVLKPPFRSKPYELPSAFFTCSQLRHLFLKDCLIRPHPVFELKNVPLLSKVSYEPTEFSVEVEHDVDKIFESIPALENLC